jgi:exodeoxyribonuclease VII small subunit
MAMSFEKNVARLDQIARKLDSEDIELTTALELFEEGVEVLRSAAAELKGAEGKVKILVEKLDGSFDLNDHPV